MGVLTRPAAHTLDENPLHFRVLWLEKTQAPPEMSTPSDEYTLCLEYPRIARKAGWGLSRERVERYGAAIAEAINARAVYWVDLTIPPFPRNVAFNPLGRMLNAIQARQIVEKA